MSNPKKLSPSKAAAKKAKERAKKRLQAASMDPGGSDSDLETFTEVVVPVQKVDTTGEARLDLTSMVADALAAPKVAPQTVLASVGLQGGLEERVVGLEAFMMKSHTGLSSALHALLEQVAAQTTLATRVAATAAKEKAEERSV